MKGYLFSLTAAALLSALVLALVPEGSVRRTVQLGCGLLLALTGRSPKSESGRVSSRALSAGVVKKGLEWLVVGICIHVGGALEMNGIGGAAMTYMIATELVSLLENLQIFGLDIPVLRRILDVAQGGKAE